MTFRASHVPAMGLGRRALWASGEDLHRSSPYYPSDECPGLGALWPLVKRHRQRLLLPVTDDGHLDRVTYITLRLQVHG